MGLQSSGVAGAAGAAGAAESRDPPALVISHRGASAENPEHTFAAYDRAVAQHTDVLECDLQLTADGVLVCMHDTTVDRTTGGTASGRVDSFTLEQLRTMDFGAWFGPEFAGSRIVPFEEQLRCYGKAVPGVQFYAETKAPNEYGGRMEPALVELLDRLDLVPKGKADPRTAPVIIQSFDLGSLESVKQLAPSLPTALLWVVPPTDATAPAPGAVDVMAPSEAYLVAHPEVIDQIHATGRDVHTWTVDDPAEMDRLLAAGVDGIFSNHTDTLRARVDAETGHGPRTKVDLEPGCPGVAGTVTAVADDAPLSASPTSRPQARLAESSDASPWWLLVVVVVVIGAVGGLGAWWLKQRRS